MSVHDAMWLSGFIFMVLSAIAGVIVAGKGEHMTKDYSPYSEPGWRKEIREKEKECCRNCFYCQYIKSPSITGNPIDYVCQLKGAVIDDIDIKNCDEMFERR